MVRLCGTPFAAMDSGAKVSQDQWLAARKALLAKEKEFTRLRDELSQQQRDLPWEAVTKSYVFDAPGGRQTLPELFGGRGQPLVYHFMLGPDYGMAWLNRHDEYGSKAAT